MPGDADSCTNLVSYVRYVLAQGRLLETLTGVNGIVQLLEVINVADKQCHYAGAPVDAVIISPYARPLCADDDLPMFVQV